MKLYVKQKVFSWSDRFLVKDEGGNDRYAVEGEVFSWGKKLHVYDTNGREAAFIRQKLMSFLPRYAVETAGRQVCEVVKELALFRHSYRIEGLDWRVEGNLWAHDYELYDEQRSIMRLSKQWFTWGDSYELDIPRPDDELLCLCVALAIDCAMAQDSH